MTTIMTFVDVSYDDETKIVTFSEPDYGMGETKLTIPFNQLECIYNTIRDTNGALHE